MAMSLAEAIVALDFGPLGHEKSAWYVERPQDELNALSPIELLRKRVLGAEARDKIFLSGHVGSGKSTELVRLQERADVRERFTVVDFALESHEWAHMDSRTFLFRVAAELFRWGTKHDRLGDGEWEKLVERLDAKLFGEKGIAARDGAIKAKVHLLFVEIEQELKLTETRRKQFRDLAETDVTALRDLVDALVDSLETELARHQEPARVLVVVDDLDKVRDPERQKDLFDQNLDTILSPRVAMLMTLPASVLFAGRGRQLRGTTTHLRPAPVLRRVDYAKTPEEARNERGIRFLVEAANKRLTPGLAEPAALERAALYSGGVARDFFRMLREAAFNAEGLKRPTIDDRVMESVVKHAKTELQYGLYDADLTALERVRVTHDLPAVEQIHFLDQSWVLELNGEELWFEVNPLLWAKLARRAADAGHAAG
jgi:KAP family P-loop domain